MLVSKMLTYVLVCSAFFTFASLAKSLLKVILQFYAV